MTDLIGYFQKSTSINQNQQNQPKFDLFFAFCQKIYIFEFSTCRAIIWYTYC